MLWFNPAPESPDYLDLFKFPDAWRQARRLIDVFTFNPAQLPGRPGPNSFDNLVRVGAFQKLREWHIKTAISIGAVKGWDCRAARTPQIALDQLHRIGQQGGGVDYITTDEPLVAGVADNPTSCHLPLAEAADLVAHLVRTVDEGLKRAGTVPLPAFVDGEPYPGIRLEQHEAWIKALLARGLRLAAYHIDIAIVQVKRHPEVEQHFASDLQQLKVFLAQQSIPFGVIIWSSRSPVRSDREYFQDTMDFARRIHAMIGRPDEIIVSSWARRCSTAGRCDPDHPTCEGAPASVCGKMSVPFNLPRADEGGFSHTELLQRISSLMESAIPWDSRGK